MEQVKYIDIDLIIPNPTKLELYQTKPENYEAIRDNISRVGIIEPLIINKSTKVIVSGNLRYKIAKELGMAKIPVIFTDIEEDEMDLKSISTNQQRVKSNYEILQEILFFEKFYKVGQGQRTDLHPELKEIKEKRDELYSTISRDKRTKLKKIHEIATELYGEESPEYHDVFIHLDNGSTTLNRQFKGLTEKKHKKQNESVIPETYTIIRENTQIYNKSSEDMSDVEDESVQAIITSPPYFHMRDYGTEEQAGREDSVGGFMATLMNIFDQCKRVLRPDGSLFININDCVIDGQYQAVPHMLVGLMIRAGWLFNDELIWLKNNPTYSPGKRAVRSHEYIFHFVKSPSFYYDDAWLRDLIEIDKEMVYGKNKQSPKGLSGIDFRGNVLRTNVSSTGDLRKKCAEKGFHLTHSATFPIDVPSVCGFLTTKEGDTVMDCFAGTSVTGEFARKNNRKFIGYELNPEYVKASEVRLSQTTEFWNLMPNLGSIIDNTETNFFKSTKDFSAPNYTPFSNLFEKAVHIIGKYS